MNMNKKLGRFKQWAGERMGGEAKTETSEEFKSLEEEMQLRQNGMEKLHSAMNIYLKAISQRKEMEDREKMLPIDVLATAMITHGEEFEADSLFGNCLIMMGQANEKIARVHDSYVASASESWLESLERSLAQMKEYQAARRKLESRRLAYDATLSKMQKQKKEDFRLEEELRSQRIKYEESSDDVYRRMGEIQDSEADSMASLGAFLDAELEYHDRCRDVLMNLRNKWPASPQKSRQRSRSIATPSAHVHARDESPPPLPGDRPSIKSRVGTDLSERSDRSERSTPSNGFRLPSMESSPKPSFTRSQTSGSYGFENPSISRSRTELVPPPPSRVRSGQQDPYHSENDYSASTSPDRNDRSHQREDFYRTASPSRAPASGPASRDISRSSSSTALANTYDVNSARKTAPPPPPARKKPPPPPPPKKVNLQS